MASDDAALARLFFMIIPNTKRHPNNTKTDQLPISEVITGQGRTITLTTSMNAHVEQIRFFNMLVNRKVYPTHGEMTSTRYVRTYNHYTSVCS